MVRHDTRSDVETPAAGKANDLHPPARITVLLRPKQNPCARSATPVAL